MRTRLPFPLFVTLTLLAAPLQAAVYQCTDANGKTAYQGQPCAQAATKQIVLEAAKPAESGKANGQEPANSGRGFTRAQFVGTWCFFEQELDGEKSREFVTIQLNDNGHYIWREGTFKQEGSWSYDRDEQDLYLDDVGSHRVLSATKSLLKLKRYTHMNWRAGSC
jgi:hypothetical protein